MAMARSSTSRRPSTACPMMRAEKIIRSPSHRLRIWARPPAASVSRRPMPVSIRRFASTTPRSWGIEMETGLFIHP